MDSIKSQLMDMGFHEAKVKRAIESCPEAQTLEQVMEWLIAHEDELSSDSRGGGGGVKVAKVEGKSEPTAETSGFNYSKNDKPSSEGSEDMAARKIVTVEEAQRIIVERQTKRAEEDRKRAIEDEKRRRIVGQKMAETRAELQDQERVHLAQQIRREKLEKELHRKQVLEQIARDREAMKLKNASKSPSTTAPSHKTSSSIAIKEHSKVNVTDCKIALRFPDGSSLMQKFSPQEQLAAVRLFVQMEKGTVSEIEFIAPPNKKMTESDMNETLESLGLCPASRLEVKYKQAVWTDTD